MFILRWWQKQILWKRVLLGLLAGLVVGLSMHFGLPAARADQLASTWAKPWGDGFVRLIQMMIVPLITTSLVAGITAMGHPKKLGSLGVRTLAMYMATTFFAVWLGLLTGSILRPGQGVNYQVASEKDQAELKQKLKLGEESGTAVERILKIIPTNPVDSMAKGDVLPIIFFALLLGMAILLTGEAGLPLKNLFDSAAEVVMRMTLMVMELAPLGVFALMTWVMASKGLSVLTNLLWLAISLYAACLIQIALVYGLVIIKLMARLPVQPFFRGTVDALSLAYSSSSSNATLPVTISCAEKNLGIEKSVAGSVLPLGATINMDGTSIYLGLISLFASQAVGIELTWGQYVNVAVTATLVSVGVAGIPSASLLLAATVLSIVGISQEQALLIIAFILPFDRLLDMMRTLTNVTGDLACACALAKWEGAMDESVYRSRVDV